MKRDYRVGDIVSLRGSILGPTFGVVTSVRTSATYWVRWQFERDDIMVAYTQMHPIDPVTLLGLLEKEEKSEGLDWVLKWSRRRPLPSAPEPR